jgi:hypothetical protein
MTGEVTGEVTGRSRQNRLIRRLGGTAEFDFYATSCQKEQGGWPRVTRQAQATPVNRSLAPSDTGRNEIQPRALGAGSGGAMVVAPAVDRPTAFPGQDRGRLSRNFRRHCGEETAIVRKPDQGKVVILENGESYCEFCHRLVPLIWISGCT